MSQNFEPPRLASDKAVRAAQEYAYMLARIGASCQIGYGQMLLNNMRAIVDTAFAADVAVSHEGESLTT